MNLKIEKETAKRLYPESQNWFKEVLEETFGKDCFRKKHFTEIKTYEDACKELDINHQAVYFGNDTSDEIAYKKLKIVAKAINQGWILDWNNPDQLKYYPYFNLSSGFGFSYADYHYGSTCTSVGSRLCFETQDQAAYAGQQFIDLYKEFLTINN